MKRIFFNNDEGSAWPIIIVFIVIFISSFLILVFGHVLEPVTNFIGLVDDNVDVDISAPRLGMRNIMNIFWPKGIMVVILFSIIMAMLLYYQKRRYQS